MLVTHIAGGTHAGIRRPLKLQSKDYWTCPKCGARNKYYWRNCPNQCGERRPEED